MKLNGDTSEAAPVTQVYGPVAHT